MSETRPEQRWSAAVPPLPPPSRRGRRAGDASVEATAVLLLREIEDVLAVLSERSPADFRPLPFTLSARRAVLAAAFDQQDPVPPALVVALAPLLSPRLERLAPRLRRRLGRQRRRLPLSRIREMDPSCVQRNSRLPGRTLIEKAGPRQVLHGVVRVPRFDTTENRVLFAASQRLEREAAELLASVSGAARKRPTGRARDLRRLLRASREILARPELHGVGRPRPGERPSNAMLRDPDYRAAWRAWQLLGREEARFTDEWRALEEAWAELQLLAAWVAFDTRPDLEPVASWARVRHGRVDARRVEPSRPRQWIWWTQAGPRLVQLDLDGLDLTLSVRDGETTTSSRLSGALLLEPPRVGSTAVSVIDGGASRRVALDRADSLAATLHEGPPRPATPAPVQGELVGMSLLDARQWTCDESGLTGGQPSAAAWLPVPDEQALVALGRSATWLADVAGPHKLHRDAAARAGHLIRASSGQRDTAVVVPDAMRLLARSALRAVTGPVWLVPAPVAAVLTLGPALDDIAPAPFSVLVAVQTDGCLDVAVLERRQLAEEGEEQVWVRSAPTHDGQGGRQDRASVHGGSRGAWLRSPAEQAGWSLDGGSLAPCTWQRAPSFVLDVASAVLSKWSGPRVIAVVCVGLDDAEQTALSALVPGPSRQVEPAELARGAQLFLVRHRAGLATWLDRLPRLDLVVRRGRLRTPIVLVDRDTLAAPGARIHHEPSERFQIDRGLEVVDFRMELEGRPEPAVLRISGHPLPLERPVKVRVRVSYIHGREGLSVALVPTEDAGFQRLDFRLAAGGDDVEQGATEGAPAVVEHVEPLPPVPEDLTVLRESFRRLDSAWSRLKKKDRDRAVKQAGTLAEILVNPLADLRAASRCLRAAGPGTLTPALRRELETRPAAWLGWLLGHGRRKGAGRPPKLTDREAREAVRTRAALRVRGTDGVPKALAEDNLHVPAMERLRALGLLVDGQADDLWLALLHAERKSPADHGAWALGIALALDAHPDLGASLDDKVIDFILATTVAALDEISALPTERLARFKRAVYRLLLVPPRLCRLRAHGRLPVEASQVQRAIHQLTACRDRLPEEVRTFAGRLAIGDQDEPIAVAIDHLMGLTAAIPSTEDA